MKINSDRLVAGYVDHGLREDYQSDISAIRHSVESRNIPLLIKYVKTNDYIIENRVSVEVAARVLRYRALTEMAESTGCRWILTGHTMDDSAETVLLRIRDGALWYECTGIPEQRGNILRPLLSLHRAELRTWVVSQGIPFYEDKTNSDPRFRRNQLRLKVTDYPEFWTESRIKRLHDAGHDLQQSVEGCRKGAQLFIKAYNISRNPSAIGLAINEILRYFDSLIFVPVEVAWGMLASQPDGRLSSVQRRQIVDCLRGNAQTARLELLKGLMFERRGSRIWIYRKPFAAVHRIIVCGTTRITERNAVIRVERRSIEEIPPCGTVVASERILNHPLALRNWQAGDRIKVRHRPTKKIAEWLGEQKIDPLTRNNTLVLVDDAGPVWIVGGTVAERILPHQDEQVVVWISWKTDD